MTLQLGIFFALVSAFVTNLAFFYKHRGACAAPPVDIRHPLKTARSLWSSKWFAIGMVVAIAAWGFHVAALALAPMSVVKMILAGGMVLLAIMAERLFGFEVGRRQWIGLGFTAVGLILLGLTLPATNGANSGFSTAGMIAFEVGLLGVGGLLILGPRVGAPVEHHGVMLGAAAGILFGVSDVAIKAMTGMLGNGVLGIVGPWLAICILASVAAFYASARGLQVGDAVPVIAVTGAAANISGIAGGILVFGDPLPGYTLGIVLQALAFVMVIVASALTPAPVRAAGMAPATA